MRISLDRSAWSALLISAALGAGLVAPACGGSTSAGSAGAGVTAGDPCAIEGDSADATDGCNTCVCASGSWSCTEMACGTSGAGGGGGAAGAGGGGSCAPGEVRPAADACNRCVCDAAGGWACTRMACADGGAGCVDGEQASDGCNTCTCAGGSWACTDMTCKDGGAADAGPGEVLCGGWLGDTCSPAEYCAYEEGQLCGAADASAVCRRRPEGCTLEYAPVCGCDGKTYGNSCGAAVAGTGVYRAGAC